MKKLMILALVAMFASFSVAAAAGPGPGPKAKHHHVKQCKKGKKDKCHRGPHKGPRKAPKPTNQ